ncbi:Polyisoprenoid-binding protein YceI [Psychrobacillus sp. OK028]|uniref:YceI family protein n=1 Tax=Psychrobacillus sp. OK028 TaxID=1884359 RepID=UPI000890D5B1|nr:YceI family protein [Psychrobacillus sp. OK028]SDN40705.1 Polyisoprenoid-binding protein YceI [Psychrobacillus sp. OK028]
MTKFNLDAAHSMIDFSVKHMMVSKVKGSFTNFTADLEGNTEDLTGATISFDIDVKSINTNNEDRDNHLRSADFFDIETYPSIKFVATDIKKKADGEYDVTGDLTIKDVTKPVTFDVEYGGKGTNPWGQEVVAFSADTKVNRKEFGLTWNQALETGGVLVGEDIKINVELELNPAQ